MRQTFLLLIIIAFISCGIRSNNKSELNNLNNVDTTKYTMRTDYKYDYEYDNNNLIKTTCIFAIFYQRKLATIDTSFTYCIYDPHDVLIRNEKYDLLKGKKTLTNITKYYKNYQIDLEFDGNDTISIEKEWFVNNKVVNRYCKRKPNTFAPLMEDTTSYFYDSNNHLTKQITKNLTSNKSKTFYETFDSVGNKTTIIRKNESNEIVEITDIVYDYSGKKQFEIVEIPNVTVDSTIYTNNRATIVISNNPMRRKYNFMKYDLKGNLIKEQEYIIQKSTNR